MENFVYVNPNIQRLINRIFRLLIILLVTATAFMLFLPVDETVKIKDGQIRSTNPQVKINAPFNAEVTNVPIKEGQVVKQGEVIFVFDDSKVSLDSMTADQDLVTYLNKLKTTNAALKNARIEKGRISVNKPTDMTEIDRQIYMYTQDSIDYSYQINKKKSQLSYINNLSNTYSVKSPINGTVSYVYNSTQNSPQVNAGDLLAIITPANEQYYAKIIVPENDLPYIRAGQSVNIRIDAYNYRKYGTVKGEIEHISPSLVGDNFYAIVKLKEYPINIDLKAGYRITGEIILDKLRLYQFLKKKVLSNSSLD